MTSCRRNESLQRPKTLCFDFVLTFAFENEHRFKVSKGAKIRNRYNQVPHLTQDTNGKVTNSQLDIINESQEVSRDPKATINRRAKRYSKKV